MPDARNPISVRVHLNLPSDAIVPPHALLRVRVEDVSRADKESVAVAEKVVELDPDSDVVIDVPADAIDPRSTYNVFLHVDSNGSGEIETGDYISPAAHPVLTHGATDHVDAQLIRVGPAAESKRS